MSHLVVYGERSAGRIALVSGPPNRSGDLKDKRHHAHRSSLLELTPALVESRLRELGLESDDVLRPRLVLGRVGVDVPTGVTADHDEVPHRAHVWFEIGRRLAGRVEELKPDA